MRGKIVVYSFCKDYSKGERKASVIKFQSSVYTDCQLNIYEIVQKYRNEEFLALGTDSPDVQEICPRTDLNDIINLHDAEGIRDRRQVDKMYSKIKSGGHILEKDGLPNIKLVKDSNNNWVLFDGHHSLLSYLRAGFKYLETIPHLSIMNNDGSPASDDEITVFFGKHRAKLKGKSWENYVINWQEVEPKQLSLRKQKNMGELFEALYGN